MSAHSSLPVPFGSCFVTSTRSELHKAIPSVLRAPLHGQNEWRVSPEKSAPAMMERRGWIQPVCLTVTTPDQILNNASSFDRLYIPGEFCRQGDVLNAAAESGKIILLERGAFLAPNDILRAIEKLGSARSRLILVDSGSSFGYSDRVLDPRSLEMLMHTGCPTALNLDALTTAQGERYTHAPTWPTDPRFDISLVRTALAFDVSYLILPEKRDLSAEALQLWFSARKATQ